MGLVYKSVIQISLPPNLHFKNRRVWRNDVIFILSEKTQKILTNIFLLLSENRYWKKYKNLGAVKKQHNAPTGGLPLAQLP